MKRSFINNNNNYNNDKQELNQFQTGIDKTDRFVRGTPPTHDVHRDKRSIQEIIKQNKKMQKKPMREMTSVTVM